MLSPYILRVIDSLLRIACRWYILPCSWDGENKILSQTSSVTQRNIFRCCTAFLLCQAGYRLGRFLHSFLTDAFEPSLIFMQFFFVASSLMVLALNANTVFYEMEYSQGWTLFFRYERILSQKGMAML